MRRQLGVTSAQGTGSVAPFRGIAHGASFPAALRGPHIEGLPRRRQEHGSCLANVQLMSRTVRIRRTVPHPGCQLVQGAANRLPHTTHTCTGVGAVDNRLHARKRPPAYRRITCAGAGGAVHWREGRRACPCSTATRLMGSRSAGRCNATKEPSVVLVQRRSWLLQRTKPHPVRGQRRQGRVHPTIRQQEKRLNEKPGRRRRPSSTDSDLLPTAEAGASAAGAKLVMSDGKCAKLGPSGFAWRAPRRLRS
jgi:hypothetical protein